MSCSSERKGASSHPSECHIGYGPLPLDLCILQHRIVVNISGTGSPGGKCKNGTYLLKYRRFNKDANGLFGGRGAGKHEDSVCLFAPERGCLLLRGVSVCDL